MSRRDRNKENWGEHLGIQSPTREDMSRRKFVVLTAGGVLGALAAGYALGPKLRGIFDSDEPNRPEGPVPNEVIEKAQQKRDAIKLALGKPEVVRNMKVAMDQEVPYPVEGRRPNDPATVRNPVIIDEEHKIYGLITYDQGTGEPFIRLLSGELRPASSQAGQPAPKPRTEEVNISRVFRQGGPAAGLDGREYLTAVSEAPGPISGAAPTMVAYPIAA